MTDFKKTKSLAKNKRLGLPNKVEEVSESEEIEEHSECSEDD